MDYSNFGHLSQIRVINNILLGEG